MDAHGDAMEGDKLPGSRIDFRAMLTKSTTRPVLPQWELLNTKKALLAMPKNPLWTRRCKCKKKKNQAGSSA